VKGALDEKEKVFRVSMPRQDLKVIIAGVTMTPPMGLTSWAAFQQAGDQVMVMGDMVLLEGQVNPVMSVALAHGLEVTALHNHFFWDTPKVMFMHIGGMGSEAKLAEAVGKVFTRITETSGGQGEVPRVTLSPAETSLDPKEKTMYRTILFLCPHSAAKSILAVAYCQYLAAQCGLEVHVTSAGTEPDATASPAVVALLRAEGLDVAHHRPRHVTREELGAAPRVISLGCDISHLAPLGWLVEHWDDVPSPSQHLALARDVIYTHVERLVLELKQSMGS
jgi:protein-tyrosine-phosphatase